MNNETQQMVLNMIKQKYGNNPVMQSVLSMVNSNNTGGIEPLARNLCKSMGVDADQMFMNAKNNMR